MGRKLRTNLLILPDQLKPKWPYLKEFQMQDGRVKKNSKMNFDKQHKAQSLPQIPDDASVWITNERHQPAPGRVIEQAVTPRSYIVATEDGGGTGKTQSPTSEYHTRKPRDITRSGRGDTAEARNRDSRKRTSASTTDTTDNDTISNRSWYTSSSEIWNVRYTLGKENGVLTNHCIINVCFI